MNIVIGSFMIGYSKSSQIGKEKKSQTEKNIDANAELDILYKKLGTFDVCEAQVHDNCLVVSKKSYNQKLGMTYCHRFKRSYYKSKNKQHLLASYQHTIRGCLNCHILLESNPKLTEQVFAKLRPGAF
jgi:hypothetical protein